ncbi:hypothetical protein PIB30_052448 [Stylosanthes scabra]|uniref:Uncharacterized protein n=1 Tax=Stylosanthes scabra TaxID=79078 RepID=A0ABU6YH00_9FABA|nr:hypothetical protein [Stylosanthes scabra]
MLRHHAPNHKLESEEEAATTDDKEAAQQLCEMLIEVTDTEEKDTREIFDFYEEFDSDYKEEEVEEGKLAEGWGSDTEAQNLQGEMLSINTVSDNKKNEEELPIKCEDPGLCLVTCRIKGFEIPGCLCDPGACRNVMPHALYEALELGPLRKTTDVFSTADCSIPPPGERGHPQEGLQKHFRSHPLRKRKTVKMTGECEIEMIEALIRDLLRKMKEEEGLEKNCQVEQKSYKKGEEKSQMDCLSVTEILNEMEEILYRDKGADAHLVRNNSKWK